MSLLPTTSLNDSQEVRVPLNNAWLAFQLLQSGNAFRDGSVHRTEIHALECGLDLMKTVKVFAMYRRLVSSSVLQVLNDVLDFESESRVRFVEDMLYPSGFRRNGRWSFRWVALHTGE